MAKEDNFVECECGAIINGISKEHAEKLLPEHRRSKRHKENMEAKSRREQRKLPGVKK